MKLPGMYDQIWYDPVMPTAEEHRMITEAKVRIERKHRNHTGEFNLASGPTLLGVFRLLVVLLAIAAVVTLGLLMVL